MRLREEESLVSRYREEEFERQRLCLDCWRYRRMAYAQEAVICIKVN